ncbi:MAG TPA: AMP-binding protein [Mycobacteriales bacterium]|nr:AMP-binding protein [Mycobacteriales bacterium]
MQCHPADDVRYEARVPFVADLARWGEAVAVLGPEGPVTYAELAQRVGRVADRLGPTRRLVLLEARNTLDSLVGYLGALHGGHAVVVVPADRRGELAELLAVYDPDVVLADRRLHERRTGSAHALHPDLALLLSTSGTTGSPKLVRLSARNLQANAESIAQALGICATDRAVTTLPLSYCYGLSVVHSHLLRGAGLVLTELSVVEPAFWELFRAAGGTTLAGVPATFALLDRVGFPGLDLPHLRCVTQAGGRLAPEVVRRYAELGQRSGWDLVVMYGQTEATARMACLPPELALEHPEAVGGTVPGGQLTLEPYEGAEPGTGELVYRGPNVMLGYAAGPADLALGATVDALRTGDIARRLGADLYEIVGRRGRTGKIGGLRVDLARVEDLLRRDGVQAWCVADDDALVVAVPADCAADDAGVRRLAARATGLPPAAVRPLRLAELPLRPSGKPDLPAVAALARQATADRSRDGDIAALYAEVLGRHDVSPDATFVGLGGDSLSYVEVSVRLEEALGHLPADWHTTPIRELVPRPAVRSAGRPVVETSVLLRAVAVLLVVVSHADLLEVDGGAHVLLAVAGWNAARFALDRGNRRSRVASLLRGARRIAVPSLVWIAGVYLLADRYVPANLVLLNSVLGPATLSRPWEMWFVEALVQTLLVLAALLAVPAVDRWERRAPYGFALGLVAAGLLARYGLVGETDPTRVFTPPVVFWLFALGWAAARARSPGRRAAVSALALLALPGFFGDPRREAVVAAGLLLLLWVPTVSCPRPVSRLAALLATCSLGIYLTHWTVLDRFADSPPTAVVVALALGIAYWQVVAHGTRLVRERLHAARSAVRLHRLAAGRRLPRPSRRPGAGSPARQV